MAETNSPKFGLRMYSADTDTFSRAEYMQSLQALEDRAAWDNQGSIGSRPSASISGRYWWDTGSDVLYRDNGSAWKVVAARSLDSVATSSATNTVPLTASGINAQTEDLFRATVAASVRARIKADGTINTVAGVEASKGTYTNGTAGDAVMTLKGAPSQSADMFRVRNSADTDLFKISNTGVVTSTYFGANDGAGVVGKGSASTANNMSLFAGTSVWEMLSKGGGTANAFTDFMYLKHEAVGTEAVSRRLGLLMKVGGEASGDAGKTGALYIESSAAGFANPDLVLARGDSPVARFRQDGTSAFTTAPTFSGTVTSGANEAFAVGAARMGLQGAADLYFRSGSTNLFSWYAGGVHSNTSGDAGSGGTRLAQLSKSGTNGLLATDRITLTVTGTYAPGDSAPPIRVGPAGGSRLHIAEDGIQAASGASSASMLYINADGGNVNIGEGPTTSTIRLDGKVLVDGRRFTIAASAPSSPAVGDVWVDI